TAQECPVNRQAGKPALRAGSLPQFTPAHSPARFFSKLPLLLCERIHFRPSAFPLVRARQTLPLRRFVPTSALLRLGPRHPCRSVPRLSPESAARGNGLRPPKLVRPSS